MDENQNQQFRQAVDKKNRDERQRLLAHERRLLDDAEQPDSYDPRAKSSGHGKKTADKWNQ